MPHYQRTGMISHRHPFYGFGQNPFQTPGPWAPEDEEDDEDIPVEVISPLPAPPLPATTPVAPAAPSAVPFLILGGALVIFWLTLRQ